MKTIQVGNLTIDGSKLFLIAGPRKELKEERFALS